MKRLLLAIFFLASAAAAQQAAINNVNVVDLESGKVQSGMTVLIADGKIAQVSSAKFKLPQGTQVIDGSGKYLMPALWDMHVHLTLRPEAGVAENMILPMLLAHGVVGVRDMGSDFEKLQQLRKGLTDGRVTGPHTVLSPGPFVDGAKNEGSAFVAAMNAEEARAAVRELKQRGVDFIKVQAALEREAYDAIFDEAAKLGIAVQGHIPEALSLRDAVRNRQKSIEHVSPALIGDAGILLSCSSKEDEIRAAKKQLEADAQKPDADRAALRKRQRALQGEIIDTYSLEKCAPAFAEMAKAKMYVVPTLAYGFNFRPTDAKFDGSEVPMQYVPAATRERWLGGRKGYLGRATPEDYALDQRTAAVSARLVSDLVKAGVPVLAGTDAFDAFVIPGFSLHQELELMVAGGVSPLEALRTATVNAAAFLERKDAGAVKTGYAADLLLLDADPLSNVGNTKKIAGVFSRGKHYSRADLDAVLKKGQQWADQQTGK